jgi:hypothetical protein
MADLMSYVPNRTVNGHCDCMFLYNTFRWPWTRIAAMIAPRPLLFVNSDADAIFPMDANDRVIARLERLYSLFGVGDRVDAVVSIGGHAYRQDIRQAVFRFINTHLKGDARPITDSEVDLVIEEGQKVTHPIAPERLRVFPKDSDIPSDQLNKTIDQSFVPMAKVEMPASGADAHKKWKDGLVAELRRVSFNYFPDRIPPAKVIERVKATEFRMSSENGVEFRLRMQPRDKAEKAERIALVVSSPDEMAGVPGYVDFIVSNDDSVYFCDTRGRGTTQWTRKNPPNYVERSHALLGRTVDTGRVWDMIAAARYLHAENDGKMRVYVCGKGAGGILAAYAALLEPEIAGVAVAEPPPSHMDPAAPVLVNVLRVCDIPDVLGMLAPRSLTIIDDKAATLVKAREIYDTAGAIEKFAEGEVK